MSVLFRGAAAAVVGVAAGVATGQSQYEAPASYYSTISNQTGLTLKSALHDIIDAHTVVSYDNARYALQVLDEDLAQAEHIRLWYTTSSLNLASINPDGANSGSNIKGWDLGASWQREHSWPQSRQILQQGNTTTSGADYSDLHLLRPAGSQNQTRGNRNFGGTGGDNGDPSGVYYFPGNGFRGESARLAFYADVRYDGSDSSTVDLQLVDGNPGAYQGTMGDKQALLRWHYADPVDPATELRRNDLIYRSTHWSSSTRYNDISNRTFTQGNRNPFVDRPEYVHSVFVNQANDTRLRVGTADGNGGSSAQVNLGPVIVGAAVPAGQAVTLHKEGVHGTYYSVTTSGAATSSVTGRYNAFAMDTTGSRSLTVGLNTSTAVAGNKSGTVTIDNLDVTTQGGAGRGGNDANDVINVSLNVLDHSNASFASIDTNTTAIDLGIFDLNEPGQVALDDVVRNLVATASYTAALDLDGISAHAGQAGKIDVDGLFTQLAAGQAGDLLTTVDTSAIGDFSATYRLLFSDQNLPGASAFGSESLYLTLSATVVPEPATLGMLAVSAVALLRRRRA